MAKSLKEILTSKQDYREKTVKLRSLDGEEVTIRRMMTGERRSMAQKFRIGEPDGDNLGAAQFMVALCLVPSISEEEVAEMPAEVIDEIYKAMTDLNGWTKKGAAELADQFRPTA